MNKKIVFLDIDGVLNSRRTWTGSGGWPHNFSEEHMKRFDPVALAMVRRMTLPKDVSIVLSSTWRLEFDYKVVADALRLPICSATPHIPSLKRGYEIRRWLEDNPGVERYVILDDQPTMLPEQGPFFVQTEELEGLSYQNYLDACAIINVSSSYKDPDSYYSPYGSPGG